MIPLPKWVSQIHHTPQLHHGPPVPQQELILYLKNGCNFYKNENNYHLHLNGWVREKMWGI